MSDDQVAFLRAIQLGDETEFARLTGRLKDEGPESETALRALFSAALAVAARRHFGPEATRGDVIRFVAQSRTSGGLQRVQVGAVAAEHLLLGSLHGDQEAVQALDPDETSVIAGRLLIDLLPSPPDEHVVDELLAEARERADAVLPEEAG